jgi:hypothetical protein
MDSGQSGCFEVVCGPKEKPPNTGPSSCLLAQHQLPAGTHLLFPKKLLYGKASLPKKMERRAASRTRGCAGWLTVRITAFENFHSLLHDVATGFLPLSWLARRFQTPLRSAKML